MLLIWQGSDLLIRDWIFVTVLVVAMWYIYHVLLTTVHGPHDDSDDDDDDADDVGSDTRRRCHVANVRTS